MRFRFKATQPALARLRRLARTGVALLALSVAVAGCSTHRGVEADGASSRYVFSWPFINTADLGPRGGTSRGAAVTLAPEPSPQWKALRAAGPSSRDRDRAAILAMAGDYRASFDFLETVVFQAPHEPAKPYRSWGTERVYVVEDRGDFISLQHILVMFMVDKNGDLQGPFVQKHWRQDWQYEPRSIHEYAGHRVFRRRDLRSDERRGRWSQSVWQVDDTPRYASVGRWEHTDSYSSWSGSRTGRPLPRREFSVRDDYDMLEGENRHTILPGGWTHEQDNLKQVLDGASASVRTSRAREIGVNRYDRIADFDFSAADAYWRATGPFWKVVREAFNAKLASSKALKVETRCEQTPVFMALFQYAAEIEGGAKRTPGEMRTFVADLLACVTTAPAP